MRGRQLSVLRVTAMSLLSLQPPGSNSLMKNQRENTPRVFPKLRVLRADFRTSISLRAFKGNLKSA